MAGGRSRNHWHRAHQLGITHSFLFLCIFVSAECGESWVAYSIVNTSCSSFILHPNSTLSEILSRLLCERENVKRIALSCALHRWLVRNVLLLHQCFELALPQWNSSQGQTSQPASLPLFLHHHSLFHKHGRIFARRDGDPYLECTFLKV